MFDPRVASWRAHRQGLIGEPKAKTAREALEWHGWSRSVGGGNPYVAIWARTGLTREAVDAELAATEIQEVQAARGCTYVVGQQDFGVACRVAQGFADASAMRSAKNKLGVTEQEIEVLQEKVLDALNAGPRDPKELKTTLGDAVRNFGDEGKKLGTTSTLPLALGFLQTAGRIRRVPVNGRLDNERYRYARWEPPVTLPDREAAIQELVECYFSWACPATEAGLRGWSGLPLRDLKPALESLDLVETEAGLVLASDRDAFEAWRRPTDQDVRYLGSLDNLSHLAWQFGHLVEAEHGAHPIWKELGIRGTTLADSPSHFVTDRGQVIGLWEFDPDRGEVVDFLFVPATGAIKSAREGTAAMIRETLGDMRSFSLDSSKSRQPRLAALRASAG